MRLVHTVAGLQHAHGGTSQSIPALCQALAELGHAVHLVAGRPSDRSIKSNQPASGVRTHWIDERPLGGRLLVGRGFRKSLQQLMAPSHCSVVVHDHGIWLPSNHAVAKFCNRTKVVRVISPRGMISAWAMNHAKWKKKLTWDLYQRRDLENATAFHATSLMEADELRDLGFDQPIAILPNAVDLPPPSAGMPRTGTSRRCLFLSRIHPKKGLRNLLEAWKQAGPPEGWKLIIAGPDELQHERELKSLATQLRLDEVVEFIGPIENDQKWTLYRSSELFVLPSLSENFGIVVAEALACGIPVITTTGTPWQRLRSERAGWCVSPNTDAVADAIRKATSMPAAELEQMGSRGQVWIGSEFQWKTVALQMSGFYHWLIHGGPKPAFVV